MTALSKLESWQVGFAEWLALQPEIPSKLEKQSKALALTGRRWTFKELRDVETQPAFVAQMQIIAQSQTELARKILTNSYKQFADDYLKMANLAKDAEDYDKWIKYGLPILERIIPKQADAVIPVQHVTINLGGFAARQPIEDADFEVVVNS